MLRVVAVVGPTAAGKTELALRLCEAAGGEVVVCDAYQVRAGLPLLTAKPTAAELARASHHLLGTFPLDAPATAAAYAARAAEVLADLSSRGRAAVLCGGTGLYLRALCDGLFPGPGADPSLRARLRAEAQALGTAALHARLQALDPEAAARIAPADYVRIERALEVFALTGRPISALQAEGRRRPPRYEVRRLALDPGREALRARIAARARAMVAGGVLDEVREVLRTAGPLRHPPLGFELVRRHLAGELDREGLLSALVQQTAQYARRQRTWLRRERAVTWLGAPDEAPLADLARWLRSG